MAVPAGIWVFNNADSPSGIVGTLRKRAADVLWFEFDLGNVAEIVGGETIASAIITDNPSGQLTISTPDLGDYNVGVFISDGTPGTTYELACAVTTTGGSIVSRTGLLVVS